MKTVLSAMLLWAWMVLPSYGQNAAAMSIRTKFEGMATNPAPNAQVAPPVDEWQQAKKLTLLEKVPPTPRAQGDCLPATGLVEGSLGYLECWPMSVLQVTGPTEVVLAMAAPNAPSILVTGQPTQGLASGDKARLVGPIAVVTVKGPPGATGNQMVCVVRLLTQEQLEAARTKAAAVAARKWTDAAGKFNVVASFLDFKDDQVSLKREKDGKILQVPLARLSEPDQKWVREEVARRAEAKKTPPRPPGLTSGG